jgi:hypothetical protein
MEIKFKINATVLNNALGVVSIVPPIAATPQGGSGYLFVVSGKTCKVYTKDRTQLARTSFEIEDVEGEGPFMYPSQFIDTFKFIKGDIQFTASEQDGVFRVKYLAEGGYKDDRVSFDPRSMEIFDKKIEAAEQTIQPRKFNIPILREALSVSKVFLPDAETEKTVDDHFKVVQIFGSEDPQAHPSLVKANGYMFVSNSVGAFYFYCDAFQNNDLIVSGDHLGAFEQFLSKSNGTLVVYPTEDKTYAKNSEGQVYGWSRHKSQYTKFAYYGTKQERVVLNLDRDTVTLRLQYIRAALAKGRDKIRLHYEAKADQIYFSIADENSDTVSPSMEANAKETDGKDFTAYCNVNQMLPLFRGTKVANVGFRVLIMDPDDQHPKPRYMFRTIDEFLIDDNGKVADVVDTKEGQPVVPDGAYLCRLTRFAPGKD